MAKAPVMEVFRNMRPLLTSIGARVGPDIIYALLVVFTLTYVTTVRIYRDRSRCRRR
jgi:hypothetical protein